MERSLSRMREVDGLVGGRAGREVGWRGR